MGAIVDRLVLTITEVEEWLGLSSGSGGTKLDLILVAAKELADEYCNNPFTDSDDVELAIPSAVKVGVLQLIQDTWDDNISNGNLALKKKKAEGLEIEYMLNSTVKNYISSVVQNYLTQYRLVPGF